MASWPPISAAAHSDLHHWTVSCQGLTAEPGPVAFFVGGVGRGGTVHQLLIIVPFFYYSLVSNQDFPILVFAVVTSLRDNCFLYLTSKHESKLKFVTDGLL